MQVSVEKTKKNIYQYYLIVVWTCIVPIIFIVKRNNEKQENKRLQIQKMKKKAETKMQKTDYQWEKW